MRPLFCITDFVQIPIAADSFARLDWFLPRMCTVLRTYLIQRQNLDARLGYERVLRPFLPPPLDIFSKMAGFAALD